MHNIHNIPNQILIQIMRRDGKNIHLTNNDTDITINGTTYISNKNITIGTIENNTSLLVNNTTISIAIDGKDFSKDEILANIYDNAQVTIFSVKDDENHITNLKKGFAGKIHIDGNKCNIEIRSIKQFFSNKVENRYSKTCRTSFCDKKCKLNKAEYTIENIKVKKVTNETTFTTDFSKAIIPTKISHLNSEIRKIITSGSIIVMSKYGSEVKIPILKYIGEEISLMYSHPISEGQNINILTSCDKNFTTCCNIFKNAVNFRGEPYIDITYEQIQQQQYKMHS